jgi:hypothetical protein
MTPHPGAAWRCTSRKRMATKSRRKFRSIYIKFSHSTGVSHDTSGPTTTVASTSAMATLGAPKHKQHKETQVLGMERVKLGNDGYGFQKVEINMYQELLLCGRDGGRTPSSWSTQSFAHGSLTDIQHTAAQIMNPVQAQLLAPTHINETGR